jgi:hypothetical protein
LRAIEKRDPGMPLTGPLGWPALVGGAGPGCWLAAGPGQGRPAEAVCLYRRSGQAADFCHSYPYNGATVDFALILDEKCIKKGVNQEPSI